MPILRTIATRPLCITLLAFALLFFSAQTLPSREYQIKAVFLFNFAQFVDWPQSSFPNKNSPLVIGILGEDPFGTYLDETVSGEHVNGHPLVVKRYSKVSEIKECHILFINLSKKDPLNRVLTNLRSQKILTVGDANNFIQAGGMIRFFIENGKTRMEINLDTVKSADLKISSKLLRVSEIVSTQK